MKPATFQNLIIAILLVCQSQALGASDVDELRERAEAMKSKADVLSEHGDEEQAKRLQRESIKLHEMAERLEAKIRMERDDFGAGLEKEASKLKDRMQDLRHKERMLRDNHATDSDLKNVRTEIAEMERHLGKLQTLHADKVGHRPEFRAQIEKLDRAGQRMHHLRAAAEQLKFADEHDLAHKLMAKAEEIERDLHAAKRRLANEMRPDHELNKTVEGDFLSQLKEENERLKTELRELKQNALKR